MIIYDGVISLIQKTGGATVLFEEIYKRLIRDNIEFKVAEYDKNKITFPHITSTPRIMERYRDFRTSTLKNIAPSVFHSTCYRIPNKPIAPVVTTVHDFTYEKVIGGVKSFVHSIQKNRAIRNSNHIICVSQSTKNDLLEYLPWAKEKKISVIHNGVSEEYYCKANATTENYVLYVGLRVGYKNFDSLVKSLTRHKDLTLCCVGGGAFTRNELNLLNKYLPGRFYHSGYISTSKLNDIYNSAFCFVYPSKYEGFGIPIIESMRAGCPVISVKNSSIPEVAGNAAILVDSGSPEELEEAIGMMFNSETRKSCISKGIIQSMKFSWESTYSNTIKVYQGLQ